MPYQKTNIGEDEALKMLPIAMDSARKRNCVIGVVVLDASGDVVASARMNGSGSLSLLAAEGKARASLSLGATSNRLRERTNQNVMVGVSAIAMGMTLMPGGVPIIYKGECIGAIAVAGGPAAGQVPGAGSDEQDALAAVEAVFGADVARLAADAGAPREPAKAAS